MNPLNSSRRALCTVLLAGATLAAPGCDETPTEPAVVTDARFATAWGDNDLRPGQFLAARDVEVDADGAIYVLDAYAPHVEVFAPDGSHLRRIVLDPSWRLGDALESWTGLAVQEGRIAVSDAGRGRLVQVAPDGGIDGIWDVAQRHREAHTGAFTGAAAQPMGLTFLADGSLVAAECAFPTESGHVTTWSAEGAVEATWTRGIRVSDVAVGLGGNLLVVSGWGSTLEVIGVDGTVLGDISGFVEPRGVAFASGERAYVVDAARRFVTVMRVRPGIGSWSLNEVGVFGEPGNGDGRFVKPTGVSVGPDGTVYVADVGRVPEVETPGWPVQAFAPDGSFLRGFGSVQGRAPGQFRRPVAVGYDALEGRVYVMDIGQSRIQVFDPQGQYLGEWNEAPGVFGTPGVDLAVGRNGVVYIADAARGEVRWSSPEGVPLGQTDRINQGIRPTAVATGQWLVLLDPSNGRVVQVDGQGNQVREWRSEIDAASDVAVAPDGSVFVLQSSRGRVQVYSGFGGRLQDWSPVDAEGDPLVRPRRIEVDNRGNVFVVDETAHSVSVYGHDGTFRFAWGAEGEGPGQFRAPAGLALGPAGEVFVSDAGNHRIVRFDVQ